MQGFLQVESSVRDFVDLKEEIDKLASPESTFDRIFNYLSILKNQGIDINNISYNDKLKVVKNDDNCTLQIIKLKTKEENGKTVIINEKEYKEPGLILIGNYVYAFRKGKKYDGSKSPDLEADQISRLKTLNFIFDWEVNQILNPRSFEDYVSLLREMQKAKDKSGRDINSIKFSEVVRITKINDEYEFEYFANREEAKNKYGEDVEIIGIGLVINLFKRGKSQSGKDLIVEQINSLRNIGLKVVPENERDPIIMPKSFEDYVLLLKEMQNAKDKTGRDINGIKQAEVVRITKINDEYKFEYFADREEAKSKYVEDVETLGIGTKINFLRKGKYSPKTYLTIDQMQVLLSIGFKFNKGIEDKIYKQEICKNHNIDLKINDKIIERISKIELISKINYLEANSLELVDSTGKLIDIFSMSSIDIQDNYGISLETIIDTYGKGVTKK